MIKAEINKGHVKMSVEGSGGDILTETIILVKEIIEHTKMPDIARDVMLSLIREDIVDTDNIQEMVNKL